MTGSKVETKAHATRDPPADLDSRAREIWNQLWADLDLGEEMLPVVAAYAWARSSWERACGAIDVVDGTPRRTWSDAGGERFPHPAYRLETQLAGILDSLSRTLGLEPVGRTMPRSTRVLFLDEGAPPSASKTDARRSIR